MRAQARDLADDLIARAKETAQDDNATNDDDNTHMIPLDLRKARVTQVMNLLEREYVDVHALCRSVNRVAY
jgi:hypothetical protein